MLGRVGTRFLRHCAKPALFQPVLPHSFSRSFAKQNKHRRPNESRVPPSAPNTIRNGVGAETARDPASGQTVESPTPLYPIIKPQAEPQISPSLPQTAEQSPGGISGVDDVRYSSPSTTANPQPQSVPLRPLPDLTKGIPSTLESELAAAASASRSGSTSLNIREDPSDASAGGRPGGDFPNSGYISSLERRRNRIANFMYASILGFTICGTIYLGRNWDTEEEEIKHPDAPSGWGLGLFYNRAHARLRDMLDYYNEPAFPKLLPKADASMERPYTLVLSLEDLLVHSEWTREHGWRSAKRPGVDYFLRYLSQYYELVIFTSAASMNAEPIIRKLDPFHIVMWPLFRESTKFKDGKYIKDLSYLNRDLSKVILVDTVPDHAKLQPENAIILPKWEGTLPDNGLVSLIPFLEYVATMGFTDVREALKSFEGTHIPTEFAKREAIARARFQKQLADEKSKRTRQSGIAMLGNALGIKPMGGGLDGTEQTLSESFEQGKTYQDLVRERGQRQYELMAKEIKENGEKWLKEMADEEEKMKEEAMKGFKNNLRGFFGLGRGSIGGDSGPGAGK